MYVMKVPCFLYLSFIIYETNTQGDNIYEVYIDEIFFQSVLLLHFFHTESADVTLNWPYATAHMWQLFVIRWTYEQTHSSPCDKWDGGRVSR